MYNSGRTNVILLREPAKVVSQSMCYTFYISIGFCIFIKNYFTHNSLFTDRECMVHLIKLIFLI